MNHAHLHNYALAITQAGHTFEIEVMNNRWQGAMSQGVELVRLVVRSMDLLEGADPILIRETREAIRAMLNIPVTAEAEVKPPTATQGRVGTSPPTRKEARGRQKSTNGGIRDIASQDSGPGKPDPSPESGQSAVAGRDDNSGSVPA